MELSSGAQEVHRGSAYRAALQLHVPRAVVASVLVSQEVRRGARRCRWRRELVSACTRELCARRDVRAGVPARAHIRTGNLVDLDRGREPAGP